VRALIPTESMRCARGCRWPCWSGQRIRVGRRQAGVRCD